MRLPYFILQYIKCQTLTKNFFLDYLTFYNSEFIMSKYKFKSKMCDIKKTYINGV